MRHGVPTQRRAATVKAEDCFVAGIFIGGRLASNDDMVH